MSPTCWLGFKAAQVRLLKGDKFYLRSKDYFNTTWLYWRYSQGISCDNLGTYEGNDNTNNTFSFQACLHLNPGTHHASGSLESGLILTESCNKSNKRMITCGAGSCSNSLPNEAACKLSDWRNLAIVPYIDTDSNYEKYLRIMGNTYCATSGCAYMAAGFFSTAVYNNSNDSVYHQFQVAFVTSPSQWDDRNKGGKLYHDPIVQYTSSSDRLNNCNQSLASSDYSAGRF